MKRTIYQVDAFTDRLFGGNPAGVVLDAAGLDDHVMQAMARELHCSVSAFVLAPSRAACTHKVRFFTPVGEVPLSGHATVAAFHVLAQRGDVGARATMECGAGEVPIGIDRDASTVLVTMTQKRASFAETPLRGVVSQSVGLPPDAIAPRPAPELVSTGAWLAMLPVVSVPVLQHCAPRPAKIASLGGTRRVDGVYVVALDSEAGPVSSVRARFFGAEGTGVDEDPATGLAAGALAAWLVKCKRLALEASLTVEQGIECQRPGMIAARVAADGCPSIIGRAVTAFEATLDV
jgi:trans-2,3-dihydro-3-hydroxyanthranilate isomerase